ncbi:hypothetical protein [Bacillus sp. SRB3LM]|uniref:hypothetical protein n=1 Tax=Bacillus sp. SRB3LM TaxID=2608689 RepID=UPI0018C44E2F|nr:hypothetical protein [Bacillus sp. SRB3LM]
MIKLKIKFEKIIPITILLAATLTFAPLSSFAVELDSSFTEEESMQHALDWAVLGL